MKRSEWEAIKRFDDKMRLRKKQHATRPPVSRKSDFSRLTKTDLKGIAEYLDVDINKLRWNAKKKKLFIDGVLFFEGKKAMVEWKRKIVG